MSEQTPQETPTLTAQAGKLSHVERLADEIEDTNALLRYTFSFRMIILRGLLTGFAVVIGSTVFASIIFAVIRLIFGDIPFVPNDITNL